LSVSTVKYKIVLGLALLGLMSFYVFQKNIMSVFDCAALQNFQIFALKKVVRFLINDLLMIGVIYGLFRQVEYVKVAVIVSFCGFFLFLVPYLVFKFNMGWYNGPLVSFLHRLVLNPLLMILLIPAFYYQKIKQKEY